MKLARVALLALAVGCAGAGPGATAVYAPYPGTTTAAPLREPIELYLGQREDGWTSFEMDGGKLEFDVYRTRTYVHQIARNRYAAPVVVRWEMTTLENLESPRPVVGTAILPAAPTPFGVGSDVLLTQLRPVVAASGYRMQMTVEFSFGDPHAEPDAYVYALPYPAGLAFRVGQGFRGARTHEGANEFAVDFDCPEGTPVVAMRPGLVVATHAAARYGGTTDYYDRVEQGNFVLVLHDDGTLAHYVHLAPNGVGVKAGERVARGDVLGRSGATGHVTGPHLHVDISTSAGDGNFRTFPFRFAVAPGRDEEPREGAEYAAWEDR